MKPQQASLFDLNVPLPTPVAGEINPWQLRIDNAIPPRDDFVDSVRRYGVIQPIITATVCQTSEKQNDEVHVIQGRRRTLAARMIGITAIEEKRYALKDWAQYDVLLLMLQRQHRANPAAEYFAAFRLLQGGATAVHIHAVTGVEPGQLKKLMRLGALHDDLLQAFKAGKHHGRASVPMHTIGRGFAVSVGGRNQARHPRQPQAGAGHQSRAAQCGYGRALKFPTYCGFTHRGQVDDV
ncbi:MAG: hypothetical protein HC853_00140 [Anaerolineae bacterium]|nr:hypothetical protein [Anaerolineae bacterium]